MSQQKTNAKVFAYAGLFLFFFLFSIPIIQADVSLTPNTFITRAFPGETTVFTSVVRNTNSIVSNVTLQTQSANMSCLLDNGLSFYSFLLPAQSNRTVHIFLTAAKDIPPATYQCGVTVSATEPDPEPYHPSAGGGSGGGATSNGASAPVQQQFCDVPATASDWSFTRVKVTLNTTNAKSPYSAEGSFKWRVWTLTYANCTTTTFTETQELTAFDKIQAMMQFCAENQNHSACVQQESSVVVNDVPATDTNRKWNIIGGIALVAALLVWGGVEAYRYQQRKRKE